MTVPTSDPSAVPVTPFRVVARLVSRGAGAASRRFGRGEGAVIGGHLVAAAPGAARRLAHRRRVVLVSGTNGKTTTTSLLVAALATTGPVATNGTGANTPPGIVAALAGSLARTVVLECDEAWLGWCVEQTRAAVVLLLNLSRDQLDRHHEVTGLARRWRTALSGVPVVVANSDDPNVVWAAGRAARTVWVSGSPGWLRDATACPNCSSLLLHERQSWSCRRCGLTRPSPDWRVQDGAVHGPGGHSVTLDLQLPGRANQGNAAAAIAAADALGIGPSTAGDAMRAVPGVAGRYSTYRSGRHRVRLVLAKNPAGWEQALAISGITSGPVVVAINSRGVDGRDPSWLYDVDFTSLRGRPVVASGERALDAAVRLQVDEVNVSGVIPGIRAALSALPAGDVDLIATYTAFEQARRELAGGR